MKVNDIDDLIVRRLLFLLICQKQEQLNGGCHTSGSKSAGTA